MEVEEGSQRGGPAASTASHSVVRDIGQYESPCGYCSSGNDHKNRGMITSRLCHQHYQRLLDRSWRRCGNLVYRSEAETYTSGCCPPYSIRVDALRFQPDAKQRKTLRRLRSYLDGAWEPRTSENGEDTVMREAVKKKEGKGAEAECCEPCAKLKAACWVVWEECLAPALGAFIEERGLPRCEGGLATGLGKTVRRANPKIEREYAGKSDQPVVLFSSSACFSLAKHWRGAFADAAELAGLLSAFVSEAETGFEAVEGIGAGCRVLGVDSKAGFVNVAVTMGDPRGLSCSCPRGGKRGGKNKAQGGGVKKRGSRKVLTIEMAPSAFVQEEFELFCKYQASVHKDDDSDKEGYTRFLVETPLGYDRVPAGAEGSEKPPPPLVPCEVPELTTYGSFHQQYRVDGKLVAVGVVDIMQACLSSKYFIWDPDYAFLELGKVSSLAEIDFVAKASARHRDLRYYYQGFYIHTCPKVSYKADYKPAELLCPTSLEWVTFDDDLRARMAEAGGRMLSLRGQGDGEGGAGLFLKEGRTAEELAETMTDLGKLKCLLHGKLFLLEDLVQVIPSDFKNMLLAQTARWMASCGVEMAEEMVYQLN